jgi:methionyl-tRNA synthetase
VRPCAPPPGTSRWLAAAATADRRGAPEWPDDAAEVHATLEATPDAVRAALARFDFRAAAAAVFRIVEQANRYVELAAPWHLARAERTSGAHSDRLDRVLGALVATCQVLASELWPFVPDLAARVAAACDDIGGTLPKPQPVFPRIEATASTGLATVGSGHRSPQYAAVAR